MAQGLEETGSRPCTWGLPKKLVQELDQLTGIKEHQAAGEDFWLCDSAITQFPRSFTGMCPVPHPSKDRWMVTAWHGPANPCTPLGWRKDGQSSPDWVCGGNTGTRVLYGD